MMPQESAMPRESVERFQLVPRRWYAWQMLPGYVDGTQTYSSPIYLTHVASESEGSVFLLEFINVLYLDGSQNFHLQLKALRNSKDYLVGDLLYADDAQQRIGIISHIGFGWLNQHCQHIVNQSPPELFGRAAEKNAAIYLDRAFPYVKPGTTKWQK